VWLTRTINYTKRVDIVMRLSEYITANGDQASAVLFNVSPRTAASWRRGERSPKPMKAREIAAKTQNVVSFSECFDTIPSNVSKEYSDGREENIVEIPRCINVQH